jgi:hypothetical protein
MELVIDEMVATRGNNYTENFKIFSKASKCDNVVRYKEDWTTASVPILEGNCNRQQAQYKCIPLVTVL